jgi:hypothetical protein
MLKDFLAAMAAAAVMCTLPFAASAESRRDSRITEDLLPVELRCPEDDTREDVKELTVFLRNRYLDEYMYYVYFRNGVAVEAGLRSARNGETPHWLHLARRGWSGFSAEDKAFVDKTLKAAEPIVQAGCRASKTDRLKYAEQLKLNLQRVHAEAIRDPDL